MRRQARTVALLILGALIGSMLWLPAGAQEADGVEVVRLEAFEALEARVDALEAAVLPTTTTSEAPPTTSTTSTTEAPTTLLSRQAIVDGAGLLDDTVLTPSSGFTVTQDGAVVENLDVSGVLTVKANDVTIRNVRVRGYSAVNVIRLYPGYEGLTIEHSVIEALPNPSDPTSGPTGAIGGNGASRMTVRHSEILGFADGIKAEPDSLYERNYIHMTKPAGAAKHLDGVQGSADSRWTVRENVIDADIDRGGNAAVFAQAWNGKNCYAIEDVVVEGNYLRGGNYTVYLQGGKASKGNCGPDEGAWVSGYVLRGNVFEGGARYGLARIVNRAETLIEGNVDGDGQPLEL